MYDARSQFVKKAVCCFQTGCEINWISPWICCQCSQHHYLTSPR